MDTQLLAAFLSVAKTRSFSLAAAELKLTQSAVSKRINQLEQQLQCQLFDRVGRITYLSEAGKLLLPRAKHILQEIEDTQRFIADHQGNVGGDLRIATSHHIGIHRLPPILERFTRQHSDVHLQLHFIDSEQAPQAVARGDYDIALITLPEHLPEVKVTQQTLWHDPMCFVVKPSHPLATAGGITLKQLAHFPAILPDTTTYTTGLIQRLFATQSVPLTIAMTTNHLDAIKMMVSVGLGWSVLPETLLAKGLQKIRVDNLSITRQLGCIHHKDRSLSNAATAFLALATKR